MVGCLSQSRCDEMSEAVRVRETGTSLFGRQNERVKWSQTIYASISRVLSCVLLPGRAKNERESAIENVEYI